MQTLSTHTYSSSKNVNRLTFTSSSSNISISISDSDVFIFEKFQPNLKSDLLSEMEVLKNTFSKPDSGKSELADSKNSEIKTLTPKKREKKVKKDRKLKKKEKHNKDHGSKTNSKTDLAKNGSQTRKDYQIKIPQSFIQSASKLLNSQHISASCINLNSIVQAGADQSSIKNTKNLSPLIQNNYNFQNEMHVSENHLTPDNLDSNNNCQNTEIKNQSKTNDFHLSKDSKEINQVQSLNSQIPNHVNVNKQIITDNKNVKNAANLLISNKHDSSQNKQKNKKKKLKRKSSIALSLGLKHKVS